MSDFHPAGFRLMATAQSVTDRRDLLVRIDVPTLLIWDDQHARAPAIARRPLE